MASTFFTFFVIFPDFFTLFWSPQFFPTSLLQRSQTTFSPPRQPPNRTLPNTFHTKLPSRQLPLHHISSARQPRTPSHSRPIQLHLPNNILNKAPTLNSTRNPACHHAGLCTRSCPTVYNSRTPPISPLYSTQHCPSTSHQNIDNIINVLYNRTIFGTFPAHPSYTLGDIFMHNTNHKICPALPAYRFYQPHPSSYTISPY